MNEVINKVYYKVILLRNSNLYLFYVDQLYLFLCHSVFLDEETRKAMGEQACQLADAVGYDSAGNMLSIIVNVLLQQPQYYSTVYPVKDLITEIILDL